METVELCWNIQKLNHGRLSRYVCYWDPCVWARDKALQLVFQFSFITWLAVSENWSQKWRLRCRPNFCYVSLHVRFYFQQISSRLSEHPMSRQKKLRAFHLLSCKSNYGTKNMQQIFNTRHVLENRVSTGWVGSSQNDAESSWSGKW